MHAELKQAALQAGALVLPGEYLPLPGEPALSSLSPGLQPDLVAAIQKAAADVMRYSLKPVTIIDPEPDRDMFALDAIRYVMPTPQYQWQATFDVGFLRMAAGIVNAMPQSGFIGPCGRCGDYGRRNFAEPECVQCQMRETYFNSPEAELATATYGESLIVIVSPRRGM